MFHEVEHPTVGSLKVVRSPFEVDSEFSHSRHPDAIAPGLGQHTCEVLGELNYSDVEIQTLLADGVVVSQD